MRRSLILHLAMLLSVLLLGCREDHYILELTPRGAVMERKLTFYQTGQPGSKSENTEEFLPAEEVEQITASYPPGAVTQEGQHHIASHEFAGAMPADVGGAGTYTYLSTSLGGAGFYMERFRGIDDLAGVSERGFRAADQLTDIIIGWSETEFGREPHFEDLRQFLDVNLRHDLKNLSAYSALVFGPTARLVAAISRDRMRDAETSAAESDAALQQAEIEVAIRFGQYLVERGYLKPEDVLRVMNGAETMDGKVLARLIQRFVAEKLKLAESAPLPASVAKLSDPEALVKSWGEYLIMTELYKAALRQTSSETPPREPDPMEVTQGLLYQVLGIDLENFSFDDDDHLTVKLFIPSPPVLTNGQWDDAQKQLTWDAYLGARHKHDRLPALSYAAWGDPDESFQRAHFGRVFLTGEALQKYCVWRSGLDETRALEWEALLAAVRPDDVLDDKVNAFRFSGEPQDLDSKDLAPDFPRTLIRLALDQKPRAQQE